MAIALRSVRFCGAFAVLEVRECADRTQIQIVIESGPSIATTRHMMTLTAKEWSQITALPYVADPDDTDRERQQPPANVLETFTLVDEHMSLEVQERADHSTVLIVVNGANGDDDAAMIELTAEQWRYLQILDYTTADAVARVSELEYGSESSRSSGSIH